MPASGVRCTFIYRLLDAAVTDTFTYNQPVSLSEVVDPASALMKKRLAMSGYGLVPKAIRLSKEGVFRDSKVVPATALAKDAPGLRNFTSSGGITTDNAADQPNSALLSRIDSGDFHRRQYYIAGLPDCVISTYPVGGPVENQPQWAPFWRAFRLELINKPWAFVVQRGPNDGIVQVPVLAVSQQLATGLLGVSTAGPATFAIGARVQLRNFRRQNVAQTTANGKWRVAQVVTDSPAAGQVTYFLLASAGVLASTITAPGTIEAVDFTTLSITEVTLEDPTTRKRGNRLLRGPAVRRVRRPLPI